MKCYNCGAEVRLGQRRCPNCGLIQPTAAVPNIRRPSARGSGNFYEVERAVSRSRFPKWVWIVIILAVLLIAACACIGVGVFLYLGGDIPTDLPFNLPFNLRLPTF